MKTTLIRVFDEVVDNTGEERFLKLLSHGLEKGKREEWTEGEREKFYKAQVALSKGIEELGY